MVIIEGIPKSIPPVFNRLMTGDTVNTIVASIKIHMIHSFFFEVVQ